MQCICITANWDVHQRMIVITLGRNDWIWPVLFWEVCFVYCLESWPKTLEDIYKDAWMKESISILAQLSNQIIFQMGWSTVLLLETVSVSSTSAWFILNDVSWNDCINTAHQGVTKETHPRLVYPKFLTDWPMLLLFHTYVAVIPPLHVQENKQSLVSFTTLTGVWCAQLKLLKVRLLVWSKIWHLWPTSQRVHLKVSLSSATSRIFKISIKSIVS